MATAKEKKEEVKASLKILRAELRKMHLGVTEELALPEPTEVKKRYCLALTKHYTNRAIIMNRRFDDYRGGIGINQHGAAMLALELFVALYTYFGIVLKLTLFANDFVAFDSAITLI